MWNSSHFIFLSTIHLLLFYNSNVNCATVKCEFAFFKWTYEEGSTYTCDVTNDAIFDGSRVTIDAIEGDHISGKNNQDVEALDIKFIANLNFFPQGFADHFDNINTVQVVASNLQEIKQSDLKQFPKLKVLSLNINNIKVIDENLFFYNPELTIIEIGGNQISYIDPSAFDNLIHLNMLDLANNDCENSLDYAENRIEVENIIAQIKIGECFSREIAIDKFKMAQNKIVILQAQQVNLQAKIEKIEITNRELNVKISDLEHNLSELLNKKILNVTLQNDISYETSIAEEIAEP